jgi:hypothetical protein
MRRPGTHGRHTARQKMHLDARAFLAQLAAQHPNSGVRFVEMME